MSCDLALPRERTLRGGRVVPEQEENVMLALKTKCPDKWVVVDLETGDVWGGGMAGWTRAAEDLRSEARAVLSGGSSVVKG